jgi:hypothetical protein
MTGEFGGKGGLEMEDEFFGRLLRWVSVDARPSRWSKLKSHKFTAAQCAKLMSAGLQLYIYCSGQPITGVTQLVY